MSKVIPNGKLDLRETIEKGVLGLHAGYSGFFLNSEFGLIGIEVRDYNEAVKWEDSPATKFVMDNRRLKDVDYYIGIKFPGRIQKKEVTKFFLVPLVCRCFVMSITGDLYPDDELVDAVILSCVENVADICDTSIYTNGRDMAEVIGKNRYPSPIIWGTRMFKDYINAHAKINEERIRKARSFIEQAQKMYADNGYRYGDFGPGRFYEVVIGILLIKNRIYAKYMNKKLFDEYMKESKTDMTPYIAAKFLLASAKIRAEKPVGDMDCTALTTVNHGGKKKGDKK